MVKTGQMRRCQELQKLERHVAAKHNPNVFCKLIPFQKCWFSLGTKFGNVKKKHEVFIAVFTTVH